MSRDGSIREKSVESFVASVDDRKIVVDIDDPPTEVFRGFEKQPTVVLGRLDISPCVTPTRRPILKKTETPVLSNFVNRICSVSVLRDNLEELKELFSKNPELYNSPMTGPDRVMGLKCKICKKVYSSEKKLQNHQENKHMVVYKPKNTKRVSFSDKIIVHQVKEYHKCRKCPRIFESYKLLRSHMKDQHKKRKCYICNYCNKKFVDRMFFKVHIKLHCEVCGLLLPNKSKYLDHKRNVCRVVKLHTCKTCNISLFKFMDLKDHSYEHVSTCYVCDICKDQCTTKCAIAHHIYYLHSRRRKRRNPCLYLTRKLGSENLYLCKFCEESSIDKELIENHVESLPDLTNRTMTGYKDYYFCDQCLKKFGTEQDMLQHKWTHFLKTSDNSQVRLPDTHEDQETKTVFTVNNRNRCSSNNNSNSILKRVLTKKMAIPQLASTKRFYNVRNEKIPENFQPRVVLQRMQVDEKVADIAFVDVNCIDMLNQKVCQPENSVVPNETVSLPSETVNETKETVSQLSHSVDVANGTTKQETHSVDMTNGTESLPERIVDPVTKKIVFSKHQCQICHKYYYNKSGLKSHIQLVHQEKFGCSLCSKVFRWFGKFSQHRCAQYGLAQPIYIPASNGKPNTTQINPVTESNSISNASQNEDTNPSDFDIPAPIVEMTEFENELNNQFEKNDSSDLNVQETPDSNVHELQRDSNVHEIQGVANIQKTLRVPRVLEIKAVSNVLEIQGVSNVQEIRRDSNVHEIPKDSNLHEIPKDSNVHEIQGVSNVQEIKRVYNVNEKIPDSFQPKVVLLRMSVDKMVADFKLFGAVGVYTHCDCKCKGHGKKRAPPKKTIISNHQCQHCHKYYSSNYCLNRHIETMHGNYDSLQCKVCEEVFVWPSLLQKHKCIRVHVPDMPFDDARPEIHFDNFHDVPSRSLDTRHPEITGNFDDLNILESDNYMNSVDFEIPEPIVELTEYENSLSMDKCPLNRSVSDKLQPLQHLGFKIVTQEVPIEF